MTTLSLDGVSHGYGADPVLRDVSLSVAPGEVLAVVGPSGTGKTTLLRLLALFSPPDGGRVLADGADVWSLADDGRLSVRRRIGHVSQGRSLFTASVGYNAAYGRSVRRPWGERLRSSADRLLGRWTPPDAVRDALATVGMDDRLDEPAAALSAGEAQRVAIARALATDPGVLLLDEPTSNLDPRNTAVIEGALREAREEGIAVALATHDMQQARRVADRAAVLLGGECIERGPVERVFDDPADPRAKAFVEGELVY